MTATLRESLKKHRQPRLEKRAERRGQFGKPTREDVEAATAEYLAKGGVIRKEEGVTVNGHIDPKGHWIGERKVIHVADYSPASHFDIFALDNLITCPVEKG